MIRLPPRATRVRSSAASDVYKRQVGLRLRDPGQSLRSARRSTARLRAEQGHTVGEKPDVSSSEPDGEARAGPPGGLRRRYPDVVLTEAGRAAIKASSPANAARV